MIPSTENQHYYLGLSASANPKTYLAQQLLDLRISVRVSTRVDAVYLHPEVALDVLPAQAKSGIWDILIHIAHSL